MKLTSEIFPQMVDDEASSEIKGSLNLLDRSLVRFALGNNVPFARCGEVLGYKTEKSRIVFTCASACFMNRTVMTHETTLNQFKQQPDINGEIEVFLDFWSTGILRVRYGAKPVDLTEPSFPAKGQGMLVGEPEEDVSFTVTEDEQFVFAKTSELTLKINKARFCISGYSADGKLLFEQQHNALPPVDILDMSLAQCEGDTAAFEAYAISSKEEIYGLGERFDHLNRRGAVTEFWNKDAFGTSNRRTYINIPFVLSTANYGIFLNSSARTEWEIGTKEASTLSFGTEMDVMDYFLIAGNSMQQVLYRYSGLTGFSPVPPIWSFGLWMSRNSYLSWDIVHEVADGLRLRGIPADVLHLDTAWFQKDWNCDLRFSTDRFAEPKKHMDELKQQGFRVSLWQYNFIPPNEDNVNFVEAREKGYLVKNKNGELFRYDNDLPGSWKDDAIIDFSNPEAAKWYGDQIKKVIAMGASAIKTDFGEGIPKNGVFANIEGKNFHNLYTLIYNQTIFNATKEVSGDSIVWARSGTAGSQRYPLHWGGDSQCNFAGLAGTIRAGLSAGLSGIIFYSHDIGGFIGRPTPELYARWAQVGLFCSHARCHGGGNNNSREPWAFGPEAEAIFTYYAKLRYRLLPYIITEAHYCASHAVPMMKAMILEDGDDLNLRTIDDQYLFGRSMLVAPVIEPMEHTTVRQIYLPEGIWYNYETKQKVTSRGEWISLEVTLETLPIFIKSGSVIPYGEDKQSTGNTIWPITRVEFYGQPQEDYLVTDGQKECRLSLENGKLIMDGRESEAIVEYIS